MAEGRIISQESFFDEQKKQIRTRYDLEVHKVFKGDIPNTLSFYMAGGRVGNSILTVSHQERFSKGQEGIFFLRGQSELSPVFGTITYRSGTRGAMASDMFHAYPNVNDDVYIPIQLEMGQPFRKVKNNRLEDGVEEWLSSLEIRRDDCESILDFAIRNKTISYPYFEFDITAKTNLQDLFLKNTEIILDYAPSLGSSFVLNDRVEVTKEELIQNVGYVLQESDATPQKLSIDIDNPNLLGLEEILQYEKKLCHVKMEIVAPSQNQVSGLVSFDNATMEGQSSYIDPRTDRPEEFECVLAEDQALFSSTDFTFYPDTLNAGVRDTLYIVGSGFGDAEGEVSLRNASQTNPIDSDYFAAIPPDRVEWTDNLIKVEVISLSTWNAVSNPGSGPVRLELADLTMVENSDSSELEVFYSIANVGQDERRKNLADRDDNGGYTFHLSTELDAVPNARKVVEQVLDDWHKKTCVNFSLASETIDNPSTAADSLNLIFLDSNTLSPGTLMQTFSNGVTSFFNGSGVLAAWVNNIDIIIDPSPSKPWFISTDPIDNDTMYDFYSAFSHEIGHAHQMNHVLGEQSDGINKLMYPTRGTGYETRIIGASAEQGGLNIMANNPIELNGGSAAPSMTNHESCTINSIRWEGHDSYGIAVSPNPTESILVIDYKLTDATNITFSIIDLSGRVVIYRPIGRMQEGTHKEYINTSQLPQGTYILRIQS